mmetsp:Transcript_73352/g.203584  ORF Transcript_73352/g.203584 Transcript_73352/m.203584 type:complete len:80 (-) Transcript_73352:28-267(-)
MQHEGHGGQLGPMLRLVPAVLPALHVEAPSWSLWVTPTTTLRYFCTDRGAPTSLPFPGDYNSRPKPRACTIQALTLPVA